MFALLKLLPFGWKIGILLGAIALLAGAFGAGYLKGTNKAAVKIEKYKTELATKESEYNKLMASKTVQIVTDYVTKTNTIKVKEKEYVQVAAEVVPSTGNLSTGWVYTHDQAANLGDIDYDMAADATESPYKDVDALGVVTKNYSKYHALKAQIIALQKIIEEHNKAIDEANKK